MISQSLVFLMLWYLGLCAPPSGRNWYFDSTANSIIAANFLWTPVSNISLSTGDVIAIYPAPSLLFVYYMTATEIVRAPYSGNNTQVLVRLPNGSQFGKQFLVDTKGSALWYQADSQTYRCLLNGAGCQKAAADVPTHQGLALDPLGNGVVYITSVQNSPQPIVRVYKLATQSDGTIVSTKLEVNWGCCVGVLSDVYISFASDGAIWGSVTVTSGGTSKYQIFRNADLVTYSTQPFTPPFFIAPKNPKMLFFSASKTSIYQYTLGTTSPVSVRGGLAQFLEPSDCADDCSLMGFCYSGVCSCFEEYFGPQCAIYCDDHVTCTDHGYCDFSGTCNCQPNWSGPSCSKNDITPPIFPPFFSVTGISFKNTQYSFHYDWSEQKQKFVYIAGTNITDLYDLGKEFTQSPGGHCSSKPLVDPTLSRWQVDPQATLTGTNIACAQNYMCTSWSNANTDWLVTTDNLPVRINTTEGLYLFDPAKFVLSPPSPSVWDVPKNC